MITLLNATNRPDNRTSIVSETYKQLLITKNIPHRYLNLQQVNGNLMVNQTLGIREPELETIFDNYITQSDKILLVMPEYNGGFPGILKLFIDAMPHGMLSGKKTALCGVATGRGGNLRGMDHLTGILHYLNAEVLPFKLPLSAIMQFINEGKIMHPAILNDMNKLVDLLDKY